MNQIYKFKHYLISNIKSNINKDRIDDNNNDKSKKNKNTDFQICQYVA